MTHGKLIILVGGSSAGKSSLAKALQSQFEDVYLLMGIDLFWFTLPPKQLDLETVEPEYYSWMMEERAGKQLFRIIPGPILDKLMIDRYHAIKTFLDRGFNVIADDVIWKKLWLTECLRALGDSDVAFVKVFCSDEEGARREQQRGDRHAGWNRGSAYYSDLDCLYDYEVDTTHSSPDECAEHLKSLIAKTREVTAFRRMKQREGVDQLRGD